MSRVVSKTIYVDNPISIEHGGNSYCVAEGDWIIENGNDIYSCKQEKFRANSLSTSRRTILNTNNADDEDDEDLKRRLNTYGWYLGIQHEYITSGDSTWENAFLHSGGDSG